MTLQSALLRALPAMIVLLATLLPVRAENSPMDDLQASLKLFRPSGSDPGDLVKTHSIITAGLEGRWFRGVEQLMGKSDTLDPALLKRACERIPLDVTVSDYAISMRLTYKSKTRGDKAIVETQYVDRGSGVYTFISDPEAYLDRLGIAETKRPENLRFTALPQSSGIAHVYRPGKDVLVVVPIGGVATFYMRCP